MQSQIAILKNYITKLTKSLSFSTTISKVLLSFKWGFPPSLPLPQSPLNIIFTSLLIDMVIYSKPLIRLFKEGLIIIYCLVINLKIERLIGYCWRYRYTSWENWIFIRKFNLKMNFKTGLHNFFIRIRRVVAPQHLNISNFIEKPSNFSFLILYNR